jgi:sporulation protein YlmC with PRC-barrel domain
MPVIRAGDLQGKRVRRSDGEVLGRVDELHLRDGEVIALTCGAGGWRQRFATSRQGRRIAWDRVRRITPHEILVD